MAFVPSFDIVSIICKSRELNHCGQSNLELREWSFSEVVIHTLVVNKGKYGRGETIPRTPMDPFNVFALTTGDCLIG